MRPDGALAVGLISNELVTNAVKHAFPNSREGSIELSFGNRNGRWQLTVSDDGVGSKEGGSSGLGTRLVTQLARQLGGQFRIDREGGMKAVLDLPASAVKVDAE
jgi:two-component sensor histidine kinase